MRRSVLAAVVAMLVVAGCDQGLATPSGTPGASAQAVLSASPPSSAAPGSAAASAPASASAAPSATVGPTATPSPTPTPSPTVKPTPAPIPACAPANLQAKVTGWEGAMGSQIATVLLTNASSSTCVLRGTPRLQLLDKANHVLIDSKTAGASGLPHVAPGDKTFKLAPSSSITTMVQVANYCGATDPVLPTTIAFYLPNASGRLVAKADPSGGVPGCLSSPGSDGTIQMNGWAKP